MFFENSWGLCCYVKGQIIMIPILSISGISLNIWYEFQMSSMVVSNENNSSKRLINNSTDKWPN